MAQTYGQFGSSNATQEAIDAAIAAQHESYQDAASRQGNYNLDMSDPFRGAGPTDSTRPAWIAGQNAHNAMQLQQQNRGAIQSQAQADANNAAMFQSQGITPGQAAAPYANPQWNQYYQQQLNQATPQDPRLVAQMIAANNNVVRNPSTPPPQQTNPYMPQQQQYQPQNNMSIDQQRHAPQVYQQPQGNYGAYGQPYNGMGDTGGQTYGGPQVNPSISRDTFGGGSYTGGGPNNFSSSAFGAPNTNATPQYGATGYAPTQPQQSTGGLLSTSQGGRNRYGLLSY